MSEPAPERPTYERVRVVVVLELEGDDDKAVHAAAAVAAALEGLEVPGAKVLRQSVQL